MRSVPVILSLLILCSCAYLAPEKVDDAVSPNDEDIVTRMRTLEFEGSYTELLKTGKEYIEENPDGADTPKVRVIMGEAYLEMGKPGEIREMIEPVVENAPSAQDRSDACLVMSRAGLALGDPGEAARYAFMSVALDPGSDRASEAENILDGIETIIEVNEIRSLARDFSDSPIITKFIKKQYRIAADSGKTDSEKVITGLLKTLGEDYEEVSSETEKSFSGLSRDFLIGVICPLTGRFAPLGESFVKGATIALKEARVKGSENVRLLVGDTKANPLEAQAVTKRLIHEEKVDAIIGAVSSSSTIAAAQVAEFYGTVMFSPVASERGIGDIGGFIFQEPEDDETEVIAVAKLACGELNVERIAFLASDTPGNRRMERTFMAEVERCGGEVVASDYYDEGETDFKENIFRIKEAAPEALFIPEGEDDLVLILPQLSFYEFGAQLLGLSAWDSDNLIHMAGKDMQGAVFPAELGPGKNRNRYLAASALVDEPREDANHFEVGGYMGASTIIKVIYGEKTGKSLRDLLEEDLNNRIHPYIEAASGAGIPFYTIRNGKKEVFTVQRSACGR